jgi:hypothetical protein
VFADVRKLRVAGETAAPYAPVYGAKHQVLRRPDGAAKSSRDDDALQFRSIDDERLAQYAEATRLVEKGQSRTVDVLEMNDQREFANAYVRRNSDTW